MITGVVSHKKVFSQLRKSENLTSSMLLRYHIKHLISVVVDSVAVKLRLSQNRQFYAASNPLSKPFFIS